jgi:tripartite-type tricarboxylate transporter receptor subunit TctC
MNQRRSFLLAALATLSCAVSCAASAAEFPTRPVKIVVAYPAGSTMDVVARMLATELQKNAGEAFIVDNRPGGAGQIGAEFVAKSPPDGYTLFISGSSTHSANPALYKQLRYDPVKDFSPIIQIASLTYALVASADAPVKTMNDLVKYASGRPQGVSYAYGSQLGQIAAATIGKMAGIRTLGVPYKGQPPAVTDLMGGHVSFMVADIPVLLPHVQSGKLTALAVLNNTRSPLMPQVRTLKEQGLGGYDLAGWIGLSAPANTPPELVRTLSRAAAKVLGDAGFRARLSAMGMEYEPNSPEEFGQLVSSQLDVWSRKVRDAGISPE